MRASWSWGLRRNEGCKSEFERRPGAVFYSHDSFYRADSGGAMSGRIENHLDKGLLLRIHRYVYRRYRGMARHPIGFGCFSALHQRGGGAHARGVNLADGYRLGARVPDRVAMGYLSASHRNRTETEFRSRRGQPTCGTGTAG